MTTFYVPNCPRKTCGTLKENVIANIDIAEKNVSEVMLHIAMQDEDAFGIIAIPLTTLEHNSVIKIRDIELIVKLPIPK